MHKKRILQYPSLFHDKNIQKIRNRKELPQNNKEYVKKKLQLTSHTMVKD